MTGKFKNQPEFQVSMALKPCNITELGGYLHSYAKNYFLEYSDGNVHYIFSSSNIENK